MSSNPDVTFLQNHLYSYDIKRHIRVLSLRLKESPEQLIPRPAPYYKS